jgi:hypothetical protein
MALGLSMAGLWVIARWYRHGIGIILGVLLLAAAAAALPGTARATVWLDLAAVGFATLFGLGLYLVANTLLGQHGRLLDVRNAP